MWIQLLITGLLIAVLPLSLVWVSADQNKYRKLIAVTLFLTFDLIMFGAFTRLTDSGLGCPDWPGCYGEANPFQSHSAIQAVQTAMPHGPVTVTKAWIEMIHRYLAMSVGVLILAQMIIAWWHRKSTKNSVFLPTVLFLLVCVQGAFGAWTVTLKLQPIIVTTHLLLAMGLLAMLAYLHAQQSHALQAVSRESNASVINASMSPIILPATVALIFVVMQIALGGWVSTNYAALACQDYPLCNGQLIPDMDFNHGFSLWRKLGQTMAGDYLPFQALVAVHWVHRNFALLVIAVVAWVGYEASKTKGLSSLGKKILLVIAIQFLSGVSTVYFSWPLFIAVLHNGGAALLLLLLTMLNYRARHLKNV